MLSASLVEEIINFRLPESEIRARLSELHPDRITIDDVRQFVSCIKATVIPQAVRPDFPLMDCSGTGSGRPRYNTSTTVAFILAAAGVCVAKFGNRAVGSNSGSFDFLEGLGIPVELPVAAISEILEKCGVVFLFAPQFYPGLRRLAPIRRSIATPTILNFIGPLLHPFDPVMRLLGVSNANVQRLAAQFVSESDPAARGMIVRSATNLDELEPGVENILYSVRDARVSDFTYRAATPATAATSPSGSTERSTTTTSLDYTPGENLLIFEQLLNNEAAPYFVDLVCMNAAAGLQLAGKVKELEEGRLLAGQLLQSGAVREKVEACRRAYASLPG